jgi:hypothetical protein
MLNDNTPESAGLYNLQNPVKLPLSQLFDFAANATPYERDRLFKHHAVTAHTYRHNSYE